MNKSTLINDISGRSTLTKTQIKQIIEETFDYITGALCRGEKFQVTGFGTFDVVKRSPRNGINPRTKEKITVPGRRVPVFTPGKKLKNLVNRDQD